MTKNVLIVEDLQSEITLLTYQFQELGTEPNAVPLTVAFAKTVESAREIITKIPFDVIFLDGDLTGTGLQEEPDTLPLFKEIAEKYQGKIFCTTSSQKYQEQMQTAGCPHVEKSTIASFAVEFLRKPTATYALAPGKLLAIQITGSLQVYLAKIITVSPLLVCAHDTLAPMNALRQTDFCILPDETALIQGSREQQQHLLNHYAKHMKPIQIHVAEINQQLASTDQQ